MAKGFEILYAKTGRALGATAALLRTMLLQMFYTVRTERMLMEHMN